MQYTQGNLWTFHHFDPVCITTNGMIRKDGTLVMGAGIALQAKQRFPEVPRKLADAVKIYGNRTMYLTQERMFSFPTKHDWRDKSDINLIAESCTQLVGLTNKCKFSRVYLPVPGCANGQLDWNEVNPVISDILDDRFIVVMQ